MVRHRRLRAKDAAKANLRLGPHVTTGMQVYAVFDGCTSAHQGLATDECRKVMTKPYSGSHPADSQIIIANRNRHSH